MQINWIETDRKLIFSPRLEAVTVLKEDGSTVTYKKDLLMKHGFTSRMNEEFKYTLFIVKKLQKEQSTSKSVSQI